MKKITTKKMALTAMLACLAFVLNTFVYFPAMAPFQHFVDVLAAVLVGPWYGFALWNHADDVRQNHSGGNRGNLWTCSWWIDLSENKKCLPGICW